MEYPRLAVEIFKDLVRINSPSREEGELFLRVKEYLESANLAVLQDKTDAIISSQTGNLIGIKPPLQDGVMLVTHLDRVEPGQNIQLRQEEEYFVSTGRTILGADNLAGIAAVLSFLQLNKAIIPPGLGVAFTVAEEIGLLGTSFLPDSLISSFSHSLVLDGEARVGSIFVKEPSACFFYLYLVGQSSKAASKLNLRIASSIIDDIGEQVSTFYIGGGLPLIDPNKDGVLIAVRGDNPAHLISYWPEIVVDKLQKNLPEIQGKVSLLHCSSGLDWASSEPEWIKKLSRAVENAGIKPAKLNTREISEAGLLTTRGLPAVNLGTGVEQAHSLSERIKVKELPNLVDILKQYILEGDD
ncbi:MAG: M20/M25/M40 family metallo-hydrolase [Bacillota bacterium]